MEIIPRRLLARVQESPECLESTSDISTVPCPRLPFSPGHHLGLEGPWALLFGRQGSVVGALRPPPRPVMGGADPAVK